MSDGERREFSAACELFAERFSQCYPFESVTPKMHMLTAYAPEFARTRGTVGMLSEKSVESFQAELKSLGRRYASMGWTKRKHISILHEASLRHVLTWITTLPPREFASSPKPPFRRKLKIHAACAQQRRKRQKTQHA